MKKVLIFLALLFCGVAHAGPMANVEYVHKVIAQQWGITIPYNPALENPQVAVNMKYLLTTVDVANKILNKESTTDYGNSAYATMAAADTIATNEASDRLIKIEPKFFVTTTADTTEFSFSMSTKGVFQIDWGDGNVERVVRTDTESTTYSHTYATAREYEIGIGGYTTGYSINTDTAAIAFEGNTNIAEINGSLGAVFSTVGDGNAPGTQPRFYKTFANCTNLAGAIPENLFAGVTGAPVDNMFLETFSYCRRLTGKIPTNLFSGVKGNPASTMFQSTFSNCVKLNGEIPADLFAGIKGNPASAMFQSTFRNCSGLSGTIPRTLFAGISGEPVGEMFSMTFYGCSGLTGLQAGLFSGIKGNPKSAIFHYTFYGCAGLTEIPEDLFSGIEGVPATYMFNGTFAGCSGLKSIPRNLFGEISGNAVDYMFANMFAGCASLTGASAQINGTPLYEIWPSVSFRPVEGCYKNATGLSDYADIPAVWK